MAKKATNSENPKRRARRTTAKSNTETPAQVPSPPASTPPPTPVKRTRRARKAEPALAIRHAVGGEFFDNIDEAKKHLHRLQLRQRSGQVADNLAKGMPKANNALRKALRAFVDHSVLHPEAVLNELLPLLREAVEQTDPPAAPTPTVAPTPTAAPEATQEVVTGGLSQEELACRAAMAATSSVESDGGASESARAPAEDEEDGDLSQLRPPPGIGLSLRPPSA
jgi:hypothetical protein